MTGRFYSKALGSTPFTIAWHLIYLCLEPILRESAWVLYGTLRVRVVMRVYLSLGSNLGDRNANLSAALEALHEVDGVTVTAVSRHYATEPMGVADQPEFLNLAAEIETDLTPLELLNAVKRIEQALGRTLTERWGPRSVDIDIVLWGDLILESDVLTIPHREFRSRAFVLVPLSELAATMVDPVTGNTVAELAARPEARGAIRPIDS